MPGNDEEIILSGVGLSLQKLSEILAIARAGRVLGQQAGHALRRRQLLEVFPRLLTDVFKIIAHAIDLAQRVGGQQAIKALATHRHQNNQDQGKDQEQRCQAERQQAVAQRSSPPLVPARKQRQAGH